MVQIKNMSEDIQKEVLQRITKVETLIDEGFKGVHQRQDKTNGRLDKHTERIRSLEDWRLSLTTRIAMVSSIVSGCIAVVFWIVNKYI